MIWRTAAVLLTLFALAAPASAEVLEEVRYIAVEGTGEIAAVPDMAELSAGVVARADSARDALAQNGRAMEKVLAAIKAEGIADRAVRTSQFSVVPVYDRNDRRNDAREPVAYQASNVVDVTISDMEQVGALIDTLVSAGANQVRSIRFFIKDAEALQDKARREAVLDARRKAKLYATAADVRLGDVMRIEEQRVHVPVQRMMAAEVASDAAVMPGEQMVRATLSVRFAIE